MDTLKNALQDSGFVPNIASYMKSSAACVCETTLGFPPSSSSLCPSLTFPHPSLLPHFLPNPLFFFLFPLYIYIFFFLFVVTFFWFCSVLELMTLSSESMQPITRRFFVLCQQAFTTSWCISIIGSV